MLHLINEALFSFNSETRKNDHGEHIQLFINTSSDIMRRDRESNEVYPSIRTFARLISPDQNYQNHNMAVQTRYTGPENNHAQVLFKCMPEIKHDSNVFVIAFPFNGLIRPIPESDQFRVLKGLISVSDSYNIAFNGRKFKKVLYLIVSPKMGLFAGENPIENIPVTFESFSVAKAKAEGEEDVYTREAMTVNITAKGYNVVCDKETVPPVDMEQYKGVPLFTTYIRKDEKKKENTVYESKPSGISTAMAAAMASAKTSDNAGGTATDNGKRFENKGYRKPYYSETAAYDKDSDDDDNYRKGGNKSKNRGKKSKSYR